MLLALENAISSAVLARRSGRAEIYGVVDLITWRQQTCSQRQACWQR